MNTCPTYTPINEALLWRYFAGEATSEEIDQLAQWIKSDVNHKADFHRIKELYFSTKHAPQRKQFDSKQAFLQFKQRSRPTIQASWFRPWIAVAAVVALLLGGSILFWRTSEVKTPKYATFQHSTKTPHYTLPDGSSVQLNRHSTLQYQTNAENKRTAQLQGEAYFDIVHNAALPFEVQANGLKIKVLGTSFNVNSRNPDSIVVSVASGRVLLISLQDSSKTAILCAGQSAYYAHNIISVIQNNAQNALAWKQHVLIFDATPLQEVTKTLSEYFDTTIELKAIDKDQLLSVQLKEPQLDSVLQLLQVMYHLKSTHENQKIVLQHEGQN